MPDLFKVPPHNEKFLINGLMRHGEEERIRQKRGKGFKSYELMAVDQINWYSKQFPCRKSAKQANLMLVNSYKRMARWRLSAFISLFGYPVFLWWLLA